MAATTARERNIGNGSSSGSLKRVADVLWEIPRQGEMRVPARVFADRRLVEELRDDRSLEQLANVATLPGIVDAALAMPDIHQGYGFPVGGVAATEVPDGVVSPGGVGYDINCGVRLLAAPFTADELGDRRESLVHEISRAVPAGAGKEGGKRVDLERVLVDGSRVRGSDGEVGATEPRGRLEGADPAAVSERARERGKNQLGTMGSGNHFVEVQRVEQVLEPRAADTFGLRKGQLCFLIHS